MAHRAADRSIARGAMLPSTLLRSPIGDWRPLWLLPQRPVKAQLQEGAP